LVKLVKHYRTMVHYICQTCAKVFKQKGHYDMHKTRKKPCQSAKPNVIEDLIEQKVKEAILKTAPTTAIATTAIQEDANPLVPTDQHNIIAPEYSIFNMSCIDGLLQLKEQKKKVQLTITSPPYFNVKDYVQYDTYAKYLQTLESVFRSVYDITEDGRMCCVNISCILVQRESRNAESRRIPLAFHFVPLMEKIGWKFIEDILWIKPEGAAKNRNGGFYQHRQPVAYKPNIVNEYIFIFQKPSSSLIDKVVRSYDAITSENSKVGDDYERTNVWKINPETKVNHPAPYPEELVDRLVKYYSFVGDTVLDPFMGSGTTAISSYKLNRKSIGYELHSEYIKLFEERILKVQKVSVSSKISINKEDYKDMTKEAIVKKLAKHSKKYLLSICPSSSLQDTQLSKVELVDAIYKSLFVNPT